MPINKHMMHLDIKPGILSDGLMNPDDLYMKNLLKGGLKKPKNDLFEKREEELLTNDGRKLLNEI